MKGLKLVIQVSKVFFIAFFKKGTVFSMLFVPNYLLFQNFEYFQELLTKSN